MAPHNKHSLGGCTIAAPASQQQGVHLALQKAKKCIKKNINPDRWGCNSLLVLLFLFSFFIIIIIIIIF